jgi:hypothetical protein
MDRRRSVSNGVVNQYMVLQAMEMKFFVRPSSGLREIFEEAKGFANVPMVPLKAEQDRPNT